jgi:hypothetical protein
VEAARNELVESMTPAVRNLLEKSIREKIGGIRTLNGKVAAGEQRAQSRNPANPDKEGKQEESVEPGLALEDALQEFFPAVAEGEIPNLGEDTHMEVTEKKSKKSEKPFPPPESKKSKKVEGVVGEEIEISEAELRKVYEAALQTEVQVKKGFSDIVGGGELAQAHKEHGIEKNMAQKEWEKQEPPAKEKWIPEMKQVIARGLAENKALRENLRKAVTMIETLGKKLHEVNLFNSKVLHVNKILNSAKLTREQKTFVMESIDKAQSIKEVKMVFETIVGSIKTQQALTEARNVRRPVANAQRARTTGTPNQEVLSESVDRAQANSTVSRMKELAGLVK